MLILITTLLLTASLCVSAAPENPSVGVYGALSDTLATEKPAASRDWRARADSLYSKWEVSLGTNLLYDAATQANLWLEVGFGRHFAFNGLVSYSPWDLVPNHRLRALLVQPELRFYFTKGFRGHHIGLEAHAAWYNITWPGSKIRYQDKDGNTHLYGGGLTYGYLARFSEHWGMDFEIGGGWTHMDTDCFYNVENGMKYTTVTRAVWAPTKLGISIYYRF